MAERSVVYAQSALYYYQNKKYNESIVCYYYSVLHQMIYSLLNSNNRPLQKFEINPNLEDLHLRVLYKIKERISTSDDKTFESKFNDLLELRHKADYSEDDSSEEDALKSWDLHDSLMGLLRTYFPIN